MRASERERRASGRSGVLLRRGESETAPMVDAADMTQEEKRAWVQSLSRETLEGIVLGALMQAAARRPRL